MHCWSTLRVGLAGGTRGRGRASILEGYSKYASGRKHADMKIPGPGEVRNKVLPLLQYIPSTGHSCSSGRVRQSSEAPQLRPDGRVAAHPLLGSRARLAHTQALTLLQLLRVLLERVAEGPEGLALRVELDLDLLGNAGWRPGRTVGATGLQPTAHSGEGGSRARPARAARPPRRAPARRRRCPRRSRAACARRSAPCGG